MKHARVHVLVDNPYVVEETSEVEGLGVEINGLS
jgi:hypothetical protein